MQRGEIMAKPMSLADRIRAKKKENLNTKELIQEKQLINRLNVTNIKNRTPEQASKQAPELKIEQTSKQAPELKIEQAPEQVSKHLSKQASKQAPEIDFLKKPQNLNLNQYIVLHHIYFNRPFKIKGKEGIAEVLNIKYGTVRNSIESLINKGYIHKPFSINDGINKGSNCHLNKLECLKIFGNTSDKNIKNRTPEQAPEQAPEQVSKQAPTSNSSSSSFNNKATTSKIESIFNNHPELGYWRNKNLNPKRINEWIKITDCSLETMIQYLCYCRFDMIENNHEKEKNINNVFNWFYKIIEQYGDYPKPKNYKSHQEKQIDKEQQLLETREKEIQKLKELRLKKIEQERDLDFEKMMADPEGEIYKKCFNSLNNFMKVRKNTNGFGLSMRVEFDKIIENEAEIK
jgi:hypothetical protein